MPQRYLAILAVVLIGVPAFAAEWHAILVGGSGGDAVYSRNVKDWVVRMREALLKESGLKPERIATFLEAEDSAKEARVSSLENLAKAFEGAKGALKEGDGLLLFMAGHGNISDHVGKLCLPGKDLEADTLAGWLDALPAQRVVVVNCASGGAPFEKLVAKPGRVVISAAGVEADGSATYFAEFFVRGMEQKRADADKNGHVDLLEAYAYAARETANWYHRQHLTNEKTNLWLVKGKVSREIWQRLYEGSERKMQDANDPELRRKLKAAAEKDRERRKNEAENQGKIFKDLDEVKTQDLSDLDADSPPVFGDYGPEWHNRRILTEHAKLTDHGDPEKGFALWKPYEFEQLPPAQKEGEIGYLARNTVLGR